MNTELSLYNLIKQRSRELGRKLKVICDWDEVLMGNKSLTFYKIYAKKNPNSTFADFFKDYWEKSTITYKSYGNNVVSHLDVIENARTKDPEKFNEEFKKLKDDPDFYKKSPFLTIAEEILQCLKEEIISELVIVSSYRENSFATEGLPKEEKFRESFAKFPMSNLELSAFKKDARGKRTTSRWQEIKNKNPDFDIFIDDNPRIMSEVLEAFANQPEKIYVMPDYKCNRQVQGDNIYHVKITVSDIKPIHFAIGALEYRTKKLEQGISALKQKQKNRPNSSTPTWLIIIPVVSIVLALLLWIVVWKKKPRK